MPGSGKGTQGAILSEQLLIPHISTGDIFRKMAKIQSEESKLLNEYMLSGKLIPSDLVNKIVRKFIFSDECKSGCILDGYPRNLEQAEYFVENIDTELTVLFFDVGDEIIKKRISGRYNCSSCDALYNKYFSQPKVDGICDHCGSKNFNFREDDDEDTILFRIDEYKKETLPLVEYYKRKGRFFTVDASLGKDEVTKQLSLIVKRI